MSEITGVIIELLPEKSGFSEKSQKEWCSMEFLIEHGDAPHLKKGIFSVFGKDKIDSLVVGEKVKVHFNPEANQWQDRYFCKNSVWKIDVLESVAVAPRSTQQAPKQPAPVAPAAELPSFNADDDSLPF
jgi:hypothetical protein